MQNTIHTLGALKAAGYAPKSIKNELRDNLIAVLKAGKPSFRTMHGYEHTVIPQLERAILSKHNINLLGLRGQGKTRIARLLLHLLDEYIPVVAGSEINDDPLQPLSRFATDLIAEKATKRPSLGCTAQKGFLRNSPHQTSPSLTSSVTSTPSKLPTSNSAMPTTASCILA